MKCPICGNELPDNSPYCMYCGYNSFDYNNQGNQTAPPPPSPQPSMKPANSRKPFNPIPILIAVVSVLAVILVALIIIFLPGRNTKKDTASVDTTTKQAGTTETGPQVSSGSENTTEDAAQQAVIAPLKRPSIIQTGGEVTVVPSVNAYSVKSDLSDVVNKDMIAYLTDSQKKQLASDYFIIMDYGSLEAFEVYESNRYEYYANFITVDSMMHTYHLYFSHLLKNTEKNYLSANLSSLTGSMLTESKEQYSKLKGTEWEKAAYTNLAFFAVAAKCYDPEASVPSEVADVVNKECALIDAAEGITVSPLMGSEEDYSQYKPRGYYADSDDLSRYFKTMMWYGRRNFTQSDDTLNRSALLMTVAMNDTCLSEWEAIYTVTSFFAGTSDDSGYYEYMPVIEAAYGKDASLDDIISNTEGFNTFTELTSKLDPPQINSVPIYASDSDEEAADKIIGYRFMGQRFSLDESIFQRLTYRSVQENNSGGKRMLPDALDIPAALGSDTALSILTEQGATDYKYYTENMNQIRDQIQSSDPDTWNASLYSNWLYTITPLLTEKGEGYPVFMQSEKWNKKDLTTFLGSYTELKHDTILYSKQMLAEMGGGDIPVLDDRGYVEPEAELYSRLANLVDCTSKGLDEYGYLSDSDRDNLAILLDLSLQCKTISEKELQNETLSDDEYELIRTFGGQLEHFWQEVYKDTEGVTYLSTQEFPGAIVADIASDANGSCLEVGTGRFSTMYVIVPIDGKPHVCSGPVYSFYEFTQPSSDRLTDEEWRKMLGIFDRGDGTWGSLVDLPDWEAEIISKSGQ